MAVKPLKAGNFAQVRKPCVYGECLHHLCAAVFRLKFDLIGRNR